MRLLLAALLLGGCSVVNDIDVCDRNPSPERAANARVEGWQGTRAESVAAMPGGGAFVAFASEPSGDPSETRLELRGALLDPEGTPGPTAGSANELTYSAATADLAALDLSTSPMVVPPDSDEGIGVIVYNAIDEETSQIEAIFISGSAYPLGRNLEDARFVVSEEVGPTCNLARLEPTLPARCALSAVAVPLEPSTPAPMLRRDFAVFWLAYANLTDGTLSATLRGRLLRSRFALTTPLPARDQPDPGPVDLLTRTLITDIFALPLDEGRSMVLWLEGETGDTGLVYAMVLDQYLNEVSPPTEIGRAPRGFTADSVVVGAYDGARVLAAWTERREGDETSRVVTRPVRPAGTPIGAAPRGLSESPGDQIRPAVTPLGTRDGFALAWASRGDPSDEDQSGWGIRMRVVDGHGDPLFTNQACGAGEFQVNEIHDGDQSQPSLTTLGDGSILTVWTGSDISETGIRARAWQPHELLPIER